jgi:YaiO family outer membrane protein
MIVNYLTMKTTLLGFTLLVFFTTLGFSRNTYPQGIMPVVNSRPDSLQLKSSNEKFEKYFYLVHYYDRFKEPCTLNWHMTSAQAKFKSSNLTYMGFLNYGQVLNEVAKPFNSFDMQYRADVYPVFGDQNYAYFSYAFSQSEIFPNHQVRGVFYHQFGKGFETSLGMYYMKWDRSFYIYTGSLAKYVKNYWFSLRPYIQFESGDIYQSYLLFARRYFETPDDYINLMVGYGSVPDDQAYLYNFEDIYSLKSIHFQINYQKRLHSWLFLIGAGLKLEEYTTDKTRNHWRFELGVSYKL